MLVPKNGNLRFLQYGNLRYVQPDSFKKEPDLESHAEKRPKNPALRDSDSRNRLKPSEQFICEQSGPS